MANRQISEEYISTVEFLSIGPDIELELEAWVYDMDFRHIEQYISSASRNSKSFIGGTSNTLIIHLVISVCANISFERYKDWLSFESRKALTIIYDVDDARCGHAYPMPPPDYTKILRLRETSPDFVEGRRIYEPLMGWCGRFHRRCYRIRYVDRSKADVFMRYGRVTRNGRPEAGYMEIRPEDARQPIEEVWVESPQQGMASRCYLRAIVSELEKG